MGLSLHFAVIFFSFLLHSTAVIAGAGRDYTDQLALLAIKAKIQKDPFGALSSWNQSHHFCNWVGVTCSKRHRQRVTALNLSSHSLAGTLSPHLSNLTFIRSIDLSFNNFTGEIPPELGRLRRLQELVIQSSSLQGEIPSNLSYCKELKTIWVRGHSLKGSIPHELGSLAKLTRLVLENNNLTGRIPPSLGNLSSLAVLSLRGNGLDGSIPDNLSKLKKLRTLFIGRNSLSGMLPPSFYNLSSLSYISMPMNDLEGQLSPDIGLSLPNLQIFAAAANQFSGPIPLSFANASGLVEIDLAVNQLTGSIPMNLGSLKKLQRLTFSANLLTNERDDDGLTFITSLTNCSALEVLTVAYNNLVGAIPATVSNFSNQMKMLDLAENQISGNIPTAIDNLIALYLLDLGENLLTGNIPVDIGKLRNLQGLYLSQNRLFGHVPSSLGNLTNLNELDLSNNLLEGGIPFSLGDCQQLELFYLDENRLNGTIPGKVTSFPSVIEFTINNNFFTGPLPSEISGMKSLQKLDVSDNRLTGEVPSALAKCLDLRNLLMGGNLFQGHIPSALSTMKNVEKIDLSRNNLSGQIPDFLEKYTFLCYLNLSFNDFEGEVPKQGVFGNVSAVSIIGNKKLCGGVPKLHLPPCPKLTSKKKLRVKVIILLATICALLALFSCILGVVCWLRKSKEELISACINKASHLQVSYGELIKATNGFSTDNLIGAGGHGLVYKGSLEHIEEVVAVKVLNLQLQGISKSFIAECKVLRSFRHRNLVKLLTVCSSIDFKGNDFKALVLEYMPRGSLEKWLHQVEDEEHEVIKLNFLQRLRIAIDVASALDYLHHHYDVPVVHRDLKPSNILLDDDMVAHVSDFGLAILLHDVASNSSCNQTSSAQIKGTVGYVAPEYGTATIASTHGDVYSYGVVLLEMFTGRRPTDDMFKDSLTLHQFAKMAWPDRVLEIADPRLLLEVESIGEHENRHIVTSKMQQCLVSVMKVAVACSVDSPSERMDMASVVGEMNAIKNLYLKHSSSN